MKTFKFNKEGSLWYIDLPEWKGDKKDLLMVAGADKLLDRFAHGHKSVNMTVSEENPMDESFEKMTKMVETPPFGGAVYLTKHWPIWLCKVTEFIFGKMPNTLYYKITC